MQQNWLFVHISLEQDFYAIFENWVWGENLFIPGWFYFLQWLFSPVPLIGSPRKSLQPLSVSVFILESLQSQKPQKEEVSLQFFLSK